MMKVYLLLIAICIAQCSFLQDYSEAGCGVNVVCSMVPYVKSCEVYKEYCRDGWYYNVKFHECKKITLKDDYYPTDNFFKTKKDCDSACYQPTTISEYKNLDPTTECKRSATFYSEGYDDSMFSGKLWTYDFKTKKCITYEYPASDYQPSYNIFYNKKSCEDFCINYLYNNKEGDDYNKYGGDDYMNDDYKNDDMKGEYNNDDMKGEYNNDDMKGDYSNDDMKDESNNDDMKGDYNNDDMKGDYNNEMKDESNNDQMKDESNNDDVNYDSQENKNDGAEKDMGEYNQEVADEFDSGSSMKAKGWHAPKKATQSQKMKASAKTMKAPTMKSQTVKRSSQSKLKA